jgi:hypothetical protein
MICSLQNHARFMPDFLPGRNYGPALFVTFFSRARIFRTVRFSGQGLIETGEPLGRHQSDWRSFLTTDFRAATPSGPSL